MNNVIAVITALMFLCTAAQAHSAVLDARFLAKEIKYNITQQLKQRFDGKIEVEITAMPYQEIEVPDGDVKITTDIDFNNFNPVSIVRTELYANGQKIRSFGVRTEIRVYDRVWVAKNWIKRGETLKDLVRKEKNISTILTELPDKDFTPGNYLARRNIRPGDVINRSYIEKIPTIVKNSPVSVIFKTSMVSVTIPATAVTSGSTGDYIRVRNKKFKKDYIGKIIGDNLVLVNI